MSTSGLFLLIALSFGVIVFILWPLIGAMAVDQPAPDRDRAAPPSALAALRTDHAAIVASLRDLDFDFQTGKLAESDYRQQREVLIARGVATLQQIDTLASDAIETAVAVKRAARPSVISASDDPIEAAIAAKRKRKSTVR